jgi:hypothetical protein
MQFLKTLIFLFSFLTSSLFVSNLYANCFNHTSVDQITQESTDMIICSNSRNNQYNSSQPALSFLCENGFFGLYVEPGAFNFVGGERSNVYLRGDLQDSSIFRQSTVSNDGRSILITGLYHEMSYILDALLNSNLVYIRYTDWRDVSNTLEISATGFTQAFDNLSCQLYPTLQRSDVEAVFRHNDFGNCNSTKEAHGRTYIVSFFINSLGVIEDLNIDTNDDISECLLTVVSDLNFPRNDGNTPRITYPIRF